MPDLYRCGLPVFLSLAGMHFSESGVRPLYHVTWIHQRSSGMGLPATVPPSFGNLRRAQSQPTKGPLALDSGSAHDSSTGSLQNFCLFLSFAATRAPRSVPGCFAILTVRGAVHQNEAGCMNWREEVVLVTGGTGSFGQKFVEVML